MEAAVSSRPRVIVDGKFFRLGQKKFFVKGVAYGPFMPNAQGQPFLLPERTAKDFARIEELGANLIRVYHVPPRWLLDLAEQHHLKVLVDIPWNKHLCFLDSEQQRTEAREAVRRAIHACARHPAVFAFSVANEIPPDIVRWSGTKAVADFIDELIGEAKRVDPEGLCTFTNFPPTEFLSPQRTDFVCFNVYLHHEKPFKNYLARLQMQAESKPLLLGEIGIDSLREGEDGKCKMLSWQIENAFRGGSAGVVVFSFTDEWFKDGRWVEDWKMGLVTADRQPKESFSVVRNVYRAAPYFPLPRSPRVSVVVASYNGDRTLKACLDSLQRQNYPDYEIILVDDGSTDTTPQIASLFPGVRCFRHPKNLGLSLARNTGIAAALGDIVAFTDSDCRADEDWLHYLVGDLLRSEFAGIGGPNLLPPEDSRVAAAVMVSPGGPAHVMLTDRQAEHIPGCNMAFFKSDLAEIGGFDPTFQKAGDDVDLCWRLQQAGCKIGFSPSAFVWHYRRSTIRAYLKQQRDYGEAEALLVRKHPENFNALGGGIWRGRIYTAANFGTLFHPPLIYRGLFGSAGFQSLYTSPSALPLSICTTLEYHTLVTLPLWVLSVAFHYLLPLAATSLLISTGVCAVAGSKARLPKNKSHWWSRPLIALLFFLQPIVRGWARYEGRLRWRAQALAKRESLDSLALWDSGDAPKEVSYWTGQPLERIDFVKIILQQLDQKNWPGRLDPWGECDVEIFGNHWCNLQLATVSEDHAQNRRMFRCRLRATWSLLAKVAFCAVLGVELLVLGATSRPLVWFLLPLLTAPAMAWLLNRQQKRLRRLVAVFLDELAREIHLSKVE